MADIAVELQNWLADQLPASLIGQGDDARVYHQAARQDALLPHVVLEETGGDQADVLASSRSGYARSAFTVIAVAETTEEAVDLWERIRVKLDGFSGRMGAVNVDEIYMPEYRTAGFDRSLVNSDKPVFWYASLFDVSHYTANTEN